MLDVPGILDGDPVPRLQAYDTGHGDAGNPEQAIPHGRELVKALPGNDPPQDEVSHLEGPRADTAAVVMPQCLLVPCCVERGLAMGFHLEHEVCPHEAS